MANDALARKSRTGPGPGAVKHRLTRNQRIWNQRRCARHSRLHGAELVWCCIEGHLSEKPGSTGVVDELARRGLDTQANLELAERVDARYRTVMASLAKQVLDKPKKNRSQTE